MILADFREQMTRLETFKKPTEAILEAYWKSFQHWDVSDFEYCITRALQEDDRFPKVPRLMEFRSLLHGKKKDRDVWATFLCGRCDDAFLFLNIEDEGRQGYISCACGIAFIGTKQQDTTDLHAHSKCCKRKWNADYLRKLWNERPTGETLVMLP